jgi:hypothetical protein
LDDGIVLMRMRADLLRIAAGYKPDELPTKKYSDDLPGDKIMISFITDLLASIPDIAIGGITGAAASSILIVGSPPALAFAKSLPARITAAKAASVATAKSAGAKVIADAEAVEAAVVAKAASAETRLAAAVAHAIAVELAKVNVVVAPVAVAARPASHSGGRRPCRGSGCRRGARRCRGCSGCHCGACRCSGGCAFWCRRRS